MVRTTPTIPFKKAAQTPITYLEKREMDALLGAPDRRTAQGRRDYGLLLFLYNTGARADESSAPPDRLWLGTGRIRRRGSHQRGACIVQKQQEPIVSPPLCSATVRRAE